MINKTPEHTFDALGIYQTGSHGFTFDSSTTGNSAIITNIDGRHSPQATSGWQRRKSLLFSRPHGVSPPSSPELLIMDEMSISLPVASAAEEVSNVPFMNSVVSSQAALPAAACANGGSGSPTPPNGTLSKSLQPVLITRRVERVSDILRHDHKMLIQIIQQLWCAAVTTSRNSLLQVYLTRHGNKGARSEEKDINDAKQLFEHRLNFNLLTLYAALSLFDAASNNGSPTGKSDIPYFNIFSNDEGDGLQDMYGVSYATKYNLIATEAAHDRFIKSTKLKRLVSELASLTDTLLPAANLSLSNKKNKLIAALQYTQSDLCPPKVEHLLWQLHKMLLKLKPKMGVHGSLAK